MAGLLELRPQSQRVSCALCCNAPFLTRPSTPVARLVRGAGVRLELTRVAPPEMGWALPHPSSWQPAACPARSHGWPCASWAWGSMSWCLLGSLQQTGLLAGTPVGASNFFIWLRLTQDKLLFHSAWGTWSFPMCFSIFYCDCFGGFCIQMSVRASVCMRPAVSLMMSSQWIHSLACNQNHFARG